MVDFYLDSSMIFHYELQVKVLCLLAKAAGSLPGHLHFTYLRNTIALFFSAEESKVTDCEEFTIDCHYSKLRLC